MIVCDSSVKEIRLCFVVLVCRVGRDGERPLEREERPSTKAFRRRFDGSKLSEFNWDSYCLSVFSRAHYFEGWVRKRENIFSSEQK